MADTGSAAPARGRHRGGQPLRTARLPGGVPPRRIPLCRHSQRRKSARWRRSPCPGPRPHSVGRRLERYKGHQRVVEALPIIKQTVPHATLRIYGAGPYEAELRASIQSLGVEQSAEIQYIAPDNRAGVAEALCEAEVFAALSEYEAHPVAVMEALTLGIPTVGLDTAGIGDLVADGLVTGIPGQASPQTVAQILVSALTSSTLPASDLRTLWTWDRAATDLARVYLDASTVSLEPADTQHG